jgi:hypothetical protein
MVRSSNPPVSEPQAAAPSRGKKALFVALLILGLAVFTEAASYVLLWATDGTRPAPARLREERAAVQALGTLETGHGSLVAPLPGRRRIAWGDQVVHPYLGFVQQSRVRPDAYRRTTNHGFLAWIEPPPGTPDERFTVGVFGGSVAQEFAFLGRDALVAELARLPAAAGKTVWVECYGLGGFKQPQPLMALNYLLALGHRLDLVILLDGFNEIVLPVAENLRIGVYPFYPRGWPDRVQELPDADVLRRVGEIAYLRGRRAERAGLCASGPLAASPTCHLVWRALDRRLARRIAALEEEVATLPRRRRTFLTTGPPYQRGKPEEVFRDLAVYWGRCSRLMAGLCRGQGIPYFHFLQPNQYVPGSKIFTAAERQVALSQKELYRPYAEQGYPYLVEEGRELEREGLPFFDLTMLFAGIAEPLYADTCCHLNQRGNELLGTHLGRVVVRELAGG